MGDHATIITIRIYLTENEKTFDLDVPQIIGISHPVKKDTIVAEFFKDNIKTITLEIIRFYSKLTQILNTETKEIETFEKEFKFITSENGLIILQNEKNIISDEYFPPLGNSVQAKKLSHEKTNERTVYEKKYKKILVKYVQNSSMESYIEFPGDSTLDEIHKFLIFVKLSQ